MSYRDRDYDRDRDRRPIPFPFPEQDRFGNGGGQSYRPGRAPPPPSGAAPRNSYNNEPRPARSPPRADPPSYMNSYHPPGRSAAGFDRPRSPPPTYATRPRSPLGNRDGPDFRSRPASPPPRPFGRDDNYRRDAWRDERDAPRYGQQQPSRPPIDTSYIPQKRSRETSPISNRAGRSSPSNAKRGRLASPPRRYENNYRPASPERHSQPSATRDDAPVGGASWRRRRSSSPPRYRAQPAPNPAAVSRRSPPPIHPSRLGAVGGDDRPSQSVQHYNVAERDGPSRPRSPPQYQISQAPPRRPSSPPPPTVSRHADNYAARNEPSAMPRADTTSSETRPTGPDPMRNQPYQERTPANDRGFDAGRYNTHGPRDDTQEHTRSDAGVNGHQQQSVPRGGYGGPPQRESPAAMPPTGPRNTALQPPSRPSRTVPMTTTSRSQRFGSVSVATPSTSQQYLNNLPQIVERGRRLPSLYDKSRIGRLEDEAERIREIVMEKELKRRNAERDWARLQRESETAGLRADLADQSVRAMAGEDLHTSAAF